MAKKSSAITKRKKKGLVPTKSEAAKLKEELEEAKRQRDEFVESLKRLQAEFENYRKRVDKEKEEFVKFANEGILLKLLDVSENLERALYSAKGANKDLLEGLEMVYRQLDDILKKEGLEPIAAVGTAFDPFKHEVLIGEEKEDCDEGIILEELQRGYTLKGKVIRYSKVKVSKSK